MVFESTYKSEKPAKYPKESIESPQCFFCDELDSIQISEFNLSGSQSPSAGMIQVSHRVQVKSQLGCFRFFFYKCWEGVF